jgi:ribulose kinase
MSDLVAAVDVGTGSARAGILDRTGRLLGGRLADEDTERHMGLIAGTSSCVMALSPDPRPVQGVWGPYFEAVLPGLWMNEGGQSATGALLDHIIAWHGAGGQPNPANHGRIADRVRELRAIEGEAFAARLHVLPDFHGNRSPRADPHAVGVISGLTLDASFDSLCRLYWRTAVGIALGVRHIVDTLNQCGYAIDTLHVTGGHTKNPLLMELYAAATGCAVVEPAARDAVLLGTAMVAATASGLYSSLSDAAVAMGQGGHERRADSAAAARFERDYRVFLAMYEQRKVIDGL